MTCVLIRANVCPVQNIDHKRLWLNWQVKYCDDRESLLTSNFKIEELDCLEDRINVQVPLLWLGNLAVKHSWLHTLRNPQHIPEDPWELVRFIEKLKN